MGVVKLMLGIEKTLFTQRELPTGIAYAWYDFSYDYNGPHWVAGMSGKTLALIPRRDFHKVADGQELRRITGQIFIKGEDLEGNLRTNVQGGYYPVGFLLITRPKINEVPSHTCLRCGKAMLSRHFDEESERGLDRVTCLAGDCGFWWDEPFRETSELPGMELESMQQLMDRYGE